MTSYPLFFCKIFFLTLDMVCYYIILKPSENHYNVKKMI